MTREEWLTLAVEDLRAGLFHEAGAEIPPVRVSIGFPSGGDPRMKIGEHWHPNATADGTSQVYVSPTIADPIRALDVLVHELVHACRPDAQHGKHFRQLAVAVGLTGPMRATVAGEALRERLHALSQKLGQFPHAAIDLGLSSRKKQGTRMHKCTCAECGYTCRTTQKWLDEAGTPICPTCMEPMGTEQSNPGEED